MILNKEYWENRYHKNDFPWDAGDITTPLKEYFDQIKNKNIRILIPGCGNSYEFEYLISQGFTNVTVLDYAENPVENLKKRIPESYHKNILHADFFTHERQYDLIIEQTFFCALSPDLRKDYVQKMYQLLSEKGKIAGLLFQFPLTEAGPPFGGSKEEYIHLFSGLFEIKTLETAHNSIKPRQENELFFIFTKKTTP
ncbi:TPMT family class I SAM-dependent methyltransferase [Flavobacterium amniphilum]|uniref:methyltransferase n=1 Tax=Flavobacterium amniphilum TaxID=1834035 RepID=UPI00202A99E4|nr:methyltransferase domain-containing protein [Flavobacterium amniphilum]MCL9807218.1 TPMT family class I SAM-dependent methyltransferase [Flavobacterium amniphilum]